MGGAHGMQSFDTLIWDRKEAKRLKPLDMFESAAAFDNAAKDDLCAAIERAKAARGVDWSRVPDSHFGQCPVPSAQTIWLGSSDGNYPDSLTIANAPSALQPYVAGSSKIHLTISADR